MSIEGEDFAYRCRDDGDLLCAENCSSLDACNDCECVVVSLEAGGDWGEVMDVIFCLSPIIFLIVVTIKPNPFPTTLSLPLAALAMLLIRLMYLGSDPLLTFASVILGLHEALTPLSIMAGAITLFETMEATYCMPYMMREMKALTAGHPVAEAMLIFAFAYMIEGASGFGTPVALGAPMLVSSGNDKVKSVVTLLVMNTFATVWGAVGTPIWFGFNGIFSPENEDDKFVDVSYKAGICLAVCAFLLIPLVLCILCPWALVKKNLIFIALSLSTVIAPSLGLSFITESFPALLGGMIGCGGTAILIKFKVGLSALDDFVKDDGKDHMEIGSVSDFSIVAKSEQARSSSVTGSNQKEGSTASMRKKYKNASSNISELSTDGLSKREITKIEEESPEQNANNHTETTDKNEEEETEMNADSSAQNKEVVLVASDSVLEAMQSQHDELDAILGPRKEYGEGYVKELLARTSPIWLVVVLLVLTRVDEIGIKEELTRLEPNFSIFFGTYGTFRLSASLVFQLNNILTYPGLNWKFELLYLPFFMPFVLVSLFTMFVYRKDLQRKPTDIVRVVASRLRNPAIALLGALVLVQLLIRIDTAAPAYILGTVISDWLKQGFVVVTPLLGALGSFFSGSTTVSNLTFGIIQSLAAESIGVSKTSLLALQAVGASAGNGICLNNIIAALAVVGLGDVGEGTILKQTYKFVLGITTISTVVMLALFFRF